MVRKAWGGLGEQRRVDTEIPQGRRGACWARLHHLSGMQHTTRPHACPCSSAHAPPPPPPPPPHYEMFANKTRRWGCVRCGCSSGAPISYYKHIKPASGGSLWHVARAMSKFGCRKPGSCVAARTRALRRVRGVWNARRCGPFTLGRSRRPRRLAAAAAPPPVLQRHLWWPAAPFGLSTASAVAYNSNRLPATLVQCCHGLTRRRSAAARRAAGAARLPLRGAMASCAAAC